MRQWLMTLGGGTRDRSVIKCVKVNRALNQRRFAAVRHMAWVLKAGCWISGSVSIMCSKWADVSTCCQLISQAPNHSRLAGSDGKFLSLVMILRTSAMPEVLLPHILRCDNIATL